MRKSRPGRKKITDNLRFGEEISFHIDGRISYNVDYSNAKKTTYYIYVLNNTLLSDTDRGL